MGRVDSRDAAHRPGHLRRASWLTGVAGLAIVFGWLVADRRAPVPSPRANADHPIAVSEDGYVSSDGCRSCHPREYSSWQSSFHRSMTQPATPQTVVASFDGVAVDSVHGRPMQLARKSNQFWATFDDPDWNGSGAAPPRIERQVVVVTGSHHQQVYWYATGQSRLLGQLPGLYLIGDQRWIPRRAAFMQPPGEPLFSETGHWNSTCIACHTTNGRPLLAYPPNSQPVAVQVAETRVAELGVACEACHGPNQQHAAQNRSPLRRYWLHLTGQRDPTTVQPQRLSARASSQVCGQCHSVWEFYDSGGERQANTQGLSYRPGDELSATRFIAQPTEDPGLSAMPALLTADPGFVRDSFWPDGMIRVTGREYNGLIDSPCFQRATDDRRTLSCLSCHRMHQAADDSRPPAEWAADQLSQGMEGNDACLQCHQALKPALTSHTRHRADSDGSSCYNCHMPHTTYGLLKTIRTHQISSPSVAESVSAGRPNACNLCHLDKTLAWTSGYLESWYGIPPVPLADDDQRSVAASVLWALRGDAGQRAIIAQSLGWPAAQRASGNGWIAPYAGLMLDDPYAAVRFIAYRSLRTLPGFERFSYDFNAPPPQRLEATAAALAEWRRTRSASERPSSQLLFDAQGLLKADVLNRLRRQRDNRRVVLRE